MLCFFSFRSLACHTYIVSARPIYNQATIDSRREPSTFETVVRCDRSMGIEAPIETPVSMSRWFFSSVGSRCHDQAESVATLL